MTDDDAARGGDADGGSDGATRDDGAVLIARDDREYLVARGATHESDLGVLEVPPDVRTGETIETHLGEPFRVYEPRLPDLFDHLDRTGAPMMPRDVGLVIGHTGAGRDDRVLDAGTGTGILAIALGHAGCGVTTYERNPDAAEVARANVRTAGVGDRVEVRTGDAREALEDLAAGEPFDLLTLDTADAPAVVERAPELLAPGGFLAVYAPFVEGTGAAVEAAEAADLDAIETFETIQRRMEFDERGTRPSTAGVGHTGYLTFARAP